jgi:hypothetical protein
MIKQCKELTIIHHKSNYFKMDKELKYENYVKRKSLISNKHRLAYLRNKDFKSLFCKSSKIRAKIVLKHCKKEYFGYSISNYRKKYVNNECIN